MKCVYKYPLMMSEKSSAMLPEGAEILTVQVQHGKPCIWARVDPDARLVQRWLAVHGTGHNIPDDGRRYVGTFTFQLDSGALVFHVFEVR